MRFWDSPGIVPLTFSEVRSGELRMLIESDPDIVVWWAAQTECRSAFFRKRRDGTAIESEVADAIDRLTTLSTSWDEVAPAEPIRATAARLLSTRDLRAADALQLAAAIHAAAGRATSLPFVCLDTRLRVAATLEGFIVLP